MLLRFFCSCVAMLALTTSCAQPAAETCTGTDVRLRQSGTLTVATDFAFPPFAFRSRKGDLVGFDVDLVKALAKEMKLKVLFVNRGVGALVAGAIAHRHDLAASAMRDNDRLREEVCVSAPYLDADLGALVASPDGAGIADASDLGGRKVGVLDGSRAEEWALDNLSESTIASLPTTDDLLTAIRQHQLDAVVDELAIVRFAAKESPAFRTAARIETEESFVLAAAPDNGALIEQVDSALARLRTNGKRTKIERKWFGG